MFTFKTLDLYQKAKRLVMETYAMTKKLPDTELYNLISQMNRASISIPSNIAEGDGRSTNNDKIHFLDIARASLLELVCQTEICYELKYISEEEQKKFETLAEDLSIRIVNYKKFLKTKV